jgi:transposase
MGTRKKYSSDFKLKAVKAYLKEGSFTGLSKRFNIPRSVLKRWVGHYTKQGAVSLLRQQNTYSVAFKHQVVRAYQAGGLSLNDCLFKYQIPSPSTLLAWIRQYEQFGVDGFSRARGRPRSMKNKLIKRYGPLTRLEELENENLRLRAENELLKKLDALIRQKEAAQKKKQQ